MEDIKQTQWTDDAIADLILKVRNDLLKDFLDDRFLKEYVGQQFKMRDLSAVKVEFIRKDLKELFATPIDRAHYEPIISSIRESDTASLSDGNEQFFYAEVEKILKRHIYG